MSNLEDVMSSDEDFQDAVADSESKLSDQTEKLAEEIIKKETDIQQTDDWDDSTNDGNTSSKSESNVPPEKITPELIDDIIDEDELQEREKLMTSEELEANKAKADKMKLEGNELFKNKEAEKSIEVYTDALKICPTKNSKERAILYGNRAAAKVLLDFRKSAINDCSKAIELWPEYVRALYRRAKLYEQEDELDRALEDYKRISELDPNQRDAKEASIRLMPIIKERQERMQAEMISKLKDLGNMILKPFGLSTSNFQMQQDPNTGSYSVNFNQNANKQ